MGEQMDANLERAIDRVQPCGWQCEKCHSTFDLLQDALDCKCEPVKASAVDCAHGIPLNLPCGACKAESDPTGRNPHEPGAKLDSGKAPVLRGAISYFPKALEAVAQVSSFGANKYTWAGWRSVPDGVGRYGDAMVRHLIHEAADGPNDHDSGLRHAAHAAWNALARLELLIELERAAEEGK